MKYAIGIDIGATKIKGILANSAGKILICFEVPTQPKRSRAAILSDIVQLTNRLKREAESHHFKLEGVGIGIPGVINNKRELVFGGGTLERFTGLDLKKIFQTNLGSKVSVMNDSQCFALAESYFGAGKHYNRVAGIIWATGIGAGFVNKNNIEIISGNPYEIGHIVVDPNIKSGPKCGCGQRGCVVNLASGKNIIRRYRERGGRIKNADVREIYHSKEGVASEVLEDVYKYLGLSIAAFINIFNPEIIVIGGGVSNLPKPAHIKIKKYIHLYALNALTKNLKIVKSRIGNFSGALGAASLVFLRK